MSSVNKPGGNYLPVIIHGGIAYVSGQLPRRGEDLPCAGKVGAGVDLAAAQEAAALCADLCISAINHARAERTGSSRSCRSWDTSLQCQDLPSSRKS